MFGANVAGHDNYAVAEIHPAPFGIGQVTIIKNLEQYIEDVGMRFLNLIQQYDAVGISPTASVSCPPSS